MSPLCTLFTTASADGSIVYTVYNCAEDSGEFLMHGSTVYMFIVYNCTDSDKAHHMEEFGIIMER